MIKILGLAALLGLAAAEGTSITGYNKGATIIESDWFSLRYDIEADLAYGSRYYFSGATPPMDLDPSSLPIDIEMYILGVWSYIKPSISLNILKHRQMKAGWDLTLFDISPYTQLTNWYRWESEFLDDTEFMFAHAGIGYYNFLDYQAFSCRNVKTAKVSIFDYVEDDRESLGMKKKDWTYDTEYETEKYYDPWYFGNILVELGAVPEGKSHGQYTWYSQIYSFD